MLKSKLIFAVIILTLISSCSYKKGFYQTSDFRHFLRDFFASSEFQKRHIKFPIELSYYEYSNSDEDSRLTSKFIETQDWIFFEAPQHFKCEINCFDLIIYDSFEKAHKASNERVLSYEGVHNGINTSLYFKLIDKQWYLVRYEQFDN